MNEQERYKKRVEKAFEDFLESKFIEYQPFSVSDEQIIYDARERSVAKYDGGLLQKMQNFSSVYTIEGAQKMEYNGNDFTTLLLKSLNGEISRINFSDFRYYSSLYKGRTDFSSFGYTFDSANAHYINLLNTKLVNPEHLANNSGAQILLGYEFSVVNRYGKLRKCCRLFSLNEDIEQNADIIRRQVLRAQAFSLLLVAKYPVLALPCYNREHVSPYMYDITREIGSLYVTKLRAKLYEVERALRERNLSYEYNL